MAKRTSRTTKSQYNLMPQYLEENKELIIQDKSHPIQQNTHREKWLELSKVLNSSRMRATKTVEQWKKALSDLTQNSKRHYRELKLENIATGGGKKMKARIKLSRCLITKEND
ncbi:hypothetical protein FQA39_LY09438 [Lamprigera yunnana]|nr:hypothetical protein FQA39_LY09438 [Lamprigera yunnana]